MNLTNKYGIPEAIYKTILEDIYDPNPKRIGATTLCGPTMIRKLKLEHWDELVEDAADRMWALLGTAVHYVFQKQTDNAFTEQRLEYDHESGLKIVRYTDRFKGGKIEDFKVTSVWSCMRGIKPEWINELNVDAWMWREHGFEVRELWINAVLRDWSKGKIYEDNYPRIPFQKIRIPLWDKDVQMDYIDCRIQAHLNPQPCTPEEMWEKPTTYAVKKVGRKSAMRVLPTRDDAERWMLELKEADQKKCSIEKRTGERIRCKDYCLVSEFCPHNIYREAKNAVA